MLLFLFVNKTSERKISFVEEIFFKESIINFNATKKSAK